jgi:type I restriction enzyme R subunit
MREFSTATGPVDYALFVNRTLAGVVEAKPEGTTLSGFSDQASRYMGGVPEHLVRREGQVRFEYVASGTEILFRDHADPAPRSRRVFFFHRPETLYRWLADPITIRGRLQSMPPFVTAGLRECQIEAVAGLENRSPPMNRARSFRRRPAPARPTPPSSGNIAVPAGRLAFLRPDAPSDPLRQAS